MANRNNKSTWVDWEDAKRLQKVISQSKSRIEVLKNLGYYPGPKSREKLNNAIKKFNLDISSFTNRTERWDILPKVIKNCYCISDVIRAVGLTDQGENHKTAKRAIAELNLDTSHFVNKRKGGSPSPYTDEQIFAEQSQVLRSTVRKRILKENLLEYKCARCGNKGEWMGEKMTLELEHKNGVNNDNRLENLEFLCPNCHSITPTHRGKKR